MRISAGLTSAESHAGTARRVIFGLVAVLCLAVLFGLAPGLMPAAGMQQFFLGLAHCYAEHLPNLRCDAVAQPAGYTTAFGLPYVLPVAILDRIGLSLSLSGRLVSLAYLIIALLGAVMLFRKLGIRWWLTLSTAVIFLWSPIVFAQDGYGPLRLGFALVPAYAFMDLVMARRVINSSNPIQLLPIVLGTVVTITAMRLISLFMDGYSFVMGLALSGALVLTVLVQQFKNRRWASSVAAILVYGLPTLIAYFTYLFYVGGAVERAVMPLDFFRGQGVDMYALLVPSAMQWWADLSSVNHSLNWWMSYSDGPSVTMVYLGWTLILSLFFAVLGLATGWLNKIEGSVYLPGLLLVLVVSLLLAAGPSLKFADFRDEPMPERGIQFADYLMPASAASLSLGTGILYQKVPGIRNMRAVYRWMLLVKLSALLIAGMVLEQALRRPRARVFGVIALVLMIAESLPNIPQRIDYGQRQLAQFQRFRNDALESLQAMDLAGKRVLMVPAEAGADWNQFSANFLCPLARLKCYNLGGDKSLVRARLEWPLEIRELARGRWVRGNLTLVLQQQYADVVLVPLFSLREAGNYWPPSQSELAARLNGVQTLAASVGARGVRRGWFVEIVTDEFEAPSQTESKKVSAELEIVRWGPKRGSFKSGFNVQVDGRSSFWVQFPEGQEPLESMILSLNGQILETFNDSSLLSARLVDPEDHNRFPPGRYPVRLHNRDTGEVFELGMFEVIESQ